MKTFGGAEVKLRAFLTWALDEGERPAPSPAALLMALWLATSQKPYGCSEEEKIYCLRQESNPYSSVVHQPLPKLLQRLN
jgi:hypothetical protein